MKKRKHEEKRFGGLREKLYLGRVKTLADLLKLDPEWKAQAVSVLRKYCRDMTIFWRVARSTRAYMNTKKTLNYCFKMRRGEKRHRSK